MQKFKNILLVSVLILTLTSVFLLGCGCEKKEVKNSEDGVIYTILQLTDTQFGLPSELSNESVDTYELINELIKSVNPDLIILTGDSAEGPFNSAIYREMTEFFDGHKIPFAFVFGNHDDEGNTNKEALAEILKDAEYSVFEDGPEITGLGNYIINVPDACGKTAWSLFMFDSNAYDESLGGYDYIHQDQIDWYTDSVNELKKENGGTLNSMAFFHIPLKEYETAWAYKDSEEVVYHFGDKREDVCCSKTNSGLFDAMVELGSTKAVFVGHDHVNDFSLTYMGIRLTYGLKSGYGSYYEEAVTGGLSIKLKQNGFTVDQVFVDTLG